MIPIRSLCFHCDIAPTPITPIEWQMRQIQAIAKSTDPFPVDFDKAWVWVGYSTKGNAKRALEAVFKEGTDYRSFISSDKRAIGGTTKEAIHLTTDCFKKFCMMAGTEAGKQYATILSGVMLTHTILPEQSDTRYLCKCVSKCKLFIQVFIISKPYLQLQKPAYRSHSTSTPHMSTTSTMDQQNELELAKQGNAKSITVLMNHRLQPKGITAKTDLYKGRLQVNLEYAKLRDQQALVTFVCKVILSLKPPSIHKVRICGLRTDLGHTVWIHEFELGMQTNLESVLFAIDKNQNSLSTFAPSSLEVKASPEAEVKCPKCYSTQLSINKK